MRANSGKGLGIAIILLLTLAGCSTAGAPAGGSRPMFASADFRTAQQYVDFTTAQQYRKEALQAEQHGDSESALLDMEKAQALETRVNQVAVTPPMTALQLEHRAIAPAGGSTTCNNIGINRFFCF
jgi:hypothetical protein